MEKEFDVISRSFFCTNHSFDLLMLSTEICIHAFFLVPLQQK